MAEQVPTIRAIKDWAGNVPQHEMHIRTLQSLPRPVNVLTTHSAWLFSSLVLGCNGLLSGSGSVIADLQARCSRRCGATISRRARALNDRIYPLARVFYAEPWVDMHNRMKEALVLLGRLPRAIVRPPLVKLARPEIERIRDALVESGLLERQSRPRRRVAPAVIHSSLRANSSLRAPGSCLRQARGQAPRSNLASLAHACAAEIASSRCALLAMTF